MKNSILYAMSWGMIVALGACSSRRPGVFPSPNDVTKYPYSQDHGRKTAATTEYATAGDCDGFPRITQLKTPAGLCVGLVDDNSGADPMMMPRQMASFGDDVVLTDMRGWGRGDGHVYVLKKLPSGKFRRYVAMLAAELPENRKHWLYMPSTVRKGPDGLVYMGATSTILRFKIPFEKFAGLEGLDDARRERRLKEIRQEILGSVEVVLKDLPFHRYTDEDEDSLHPLKPFVFDREGNMYLGIGADSDNCGRVEDPNSRCPEAQGEGPERLGARSNILKYVFDARRSVNPRRQFWAAGIRNAMAMDIHPVTGELWEGENSREVRNAVHVDPLGPYDELNLIKRGEHYGWPYCEEDGHLSREYQGSSRDCSNFVKAAVFLPPHAAPLSMLFYQGSLLPAWYRGKLIVALHSPEDYGHRLAAFDADANGNPTGLPLDVISDWGMKSDSDKVLGSPMGTTMLADGSILISEDAGKRLVRLSVDRSADASVSSIPLSPASDQIWIHRAPR